MLIILAANQANRAMSRLRLATSMVRSKFRWWLLLEQDADVGATPLVSGMGRRDVFAKQGARNSSSSCPVCAILFRTVVAKPTGLPTVPWLAGTQGLGLSGVCLHQRLFTVPGTRSGCVVSAAAGG